MTADPIRDAFAGRLDHLMSTMSHPAGGAWTNSRLSRALTRVGVSVSDGYLSQLRRGVNNNPAASLVGGIAKVLDVPVNYFYAEDTTELDAAVEALVALRADGVREVADLARGLPPDAVAAIKQLAVLFRHLTGLPPVPDDHASVPPVIEFVDRAGQVRASGAG